MVKLGEGEYKWLHHLMVAVIFVIFGLMVYQIVMQERKRDRYFVTIILGPDGNDVTTAGLPVYPADATGTLNAGIEKVRNALADTVAADSNIDFKVPHWSEWKLNLIPTIDPTTHAQTGFRYHYTFPVHQDMLDDTDSVLHDIIEDAKTRDELFANNADDLAWAQTVFDTEVHASLAFGTYSVGVTGNASE